MGNLLKNWPTTLVGLLSAVFAVIQGARQPTIQAAFTDPVTQMAIIAAVLGFLSKYQGTTGTAANPRAEYQSDPVPKSEVVPPPTRAIPADVLPPKKP